MNTITETLTGIVNRVTYHNPDSGWSVLRVQPSNSPQQQETVTVHQTKVFAGATMEFRGVWTIDHKYGRQFKATEAIEKKPASTAAIAMGFVPQLRFKAIESCLFCCKK